MIVRFFFLSLFLLLSYLPAALGQSCLPNGTTFSTQEDIDNFAVNHPGCTEIEGDVVIEGETITNLSGLNALTTIGRDFYIKQTDSLISLEGLENLTSIGNDLWIFDNVALKTLEGLEGLNELKGQLLISGNDSLVSLKGLENLTTVKGDIAISYNDSLKSFQGLERLKVVEGFLSIRDNFSLDSLTGLGGLDTIGQYLEIRNNYSLQSLAGVEQLKHINGSLDIRFNYSLRSLTGLENLEAVGDHLHIQNYSLASLMGLKSLKTIGGSCKLLDLHYLVNLNGLEQLDSIGSALIINNTDSLVSLSGLENLNTIGYDLEIQENTALTTLGSLENLSSINGSVLIQENPALLSLTGLERLEWIEDEMIIHNNSALTSVGNLAALRFIGDDFLITNNPALSTFGELKNLETINGRISISQNNMLASLPVFEKLDSIDQDIYIRENNALSSLAGLESLTYIGSTLSITSNDNLNSLTGLDHLRDIGYDLRISDNASLNNMQGLEKLERIGFNSVRTTETMIEINNNKALSSLTGLGSADLKFIPAPFGKLIIDILENPLLSNCSVASICNHLTNEGTADLNFSGNAANCNDADYVLKSCTQLPKVNYHFFYDVNLNKVKDIGEPYYLDAGIRLDPGAVFHYAGQSEEGGTVYLEAGAYEIAYDSTITPFWELTTDSASFHFTVDSTASCDTILFGLSPNREVPAMISHINAPPARCNEFIPFNVHLKNLGTTVASGILWFEIDENIEVSLFMPPIDTFIPPNRHGWYFYDLFPGQSLNRKVTIQIPGPPDFPVGEKLNFATYADFSGPAGQYQTHATSYNPEVRCSYDPNDKLVNPDRSTHETLFEEDFIYTIRFQNTGNDVAYDVVILDTLDANLDISTFRVLSTSHPKHLLTSLEADRYLSFNFKDIFLVDSTANFEESQGYVSYMISPIDGLAEQTEIHNTASIYFDQNPPVVTNTTENIMVSELTAIFELDGLEVRLYPNPVNDHLYLQSSQDFDGLIQLTDLRGHVLMQRRINGDTAIDLSQQSKGLYFLTLKIGEQMTTEKIIKF